MWHEARKQEKATKKFINDYNRRARNRVEENRGGGGGGTGGDHQAGTQQLCLSVVGEQERIIVDNYVHRQSTRLVNCNGVEVDRFDVRLIAQTNNICLPSESSKTTATNADYTVIDAGESTLMKKLLNFERYRVLIQHEFSGQSEKKKLELIDKDFQLRSSRRISDKTRTTNPDFDIDAPLQVEVFCEENKQRLLEKIKQFYDLSIDEFESLSNSHKANLSAEQSICKMEQSRSSKQEACESPNRDENAAEEPSNVEARISQRPQSAASPTRQDEEVQETPGSSENKDNDNTAASTVTAAIDILPPLPPLPPTAQQAQNRQDEPERSNLDVVDGMPARPDRNRHQEAVARASARSRSRSRTPLRFRTVRNNNDRHNRSSRRRRRRRIRSRSRSSSSSISLHSGSRRSTSSSSRSSNRGSSSDSSASSSSSNSSSSSGSSASRSSSSGSSHSSEHSRNGRRRHRRSRRENSNRTPRQPNRNYSPPRAYRNQNNIDERRRRRRHS